MTRWLPALVFIFFRSKTVILALMAGYLTVLAFAPPDRVAFQAQVVSNGELSRRLQMIEKSDPDKRLAVLETVTMDTNRRLDGIEWLVRWLALGIACVVGETVWSAVRKVK